jgi:hypothetical protein
MLVMRTFKALRGVVVIVGLAMSMVLFAMPGVAMAKKTPELLTTAEQNELKSLLKYVKYEPTGIDGKPTVVVTGANVQIESGLRVASHFPGEIVWA